MSSLLVDQQGLTRVQVKIGNRVTRCEPYTPKVEVVQLVHSRSQHPY